MKKSTGTIAAIPLGILIAVLLVSCLGRAFPFLSSVYPASVSSGPFTRSNIDAYREAYKKPILIPRITSVRWIYAFVTAYDGYSKECVEEYAKNGPRFTIGGGHTDRSGIAADNAVIPLGSNIWIPAMKKNHSPEILPSFGVLPVDDTGGDMRLASRGLHPKFKPEPLYWLDLRVPPRYLPNITKEEARRQAYLTAASPEFNKNLRWRYVCVIPEGHTINECKASLPRNP